MQEKEINSEAILVEQFCSVLESKNSPWGDVEYAREFYYIRGKTDIIAIDKRGNVFAFEAKLQKWSNALQQAYRNTCFANCSYVILPEKTAKRAAKYKNKFTKRSVGICYIKNGGVEITLPAVHQEPIQPWLSSVAADRVMQKDGIKP